MTEHADHPFSATLSSRDLALIGCLRSLADFSQRSLSRESTEERGWRAAGQKVTFGFSSGLDRDLFMNEVRRLLPANLVRFDGESDNDPGIASARASGFPVDRNNALVGFDYLAGLILARQPPAQEGGRFRPAANHPGMWEGKNSCRGKMTRRLRKFTIRRLNSTSRAML